MGRAPRASARTRPRAHDPAASTTRRRRLRPWPGGICRLTRTRCVHASGQVARKRAAREARDLHERGTCCSDRDHGAQSVARPPLEGDASREVIEAGGCRRGSVCRGKRRKHTSGERGSQGASVGSTLPRGRGRGSEDTQEQTPRGCRAPWPRWRWCFRSAIRLPRAETPRRAPRAAGGGLHEEELPPREVCPSRSASSSARQARHRRGKRCNTGKRPRPRRGGEIPGFRIERGRGDVPLPFPREETGYEVHGPRMAGNRGRHR